MYVIVNWWYDGSNIAIVTKENGEPMKFPTKPDAEEYAARLNGHYETVDIG